MDEHEDFKIPVYTAFTKDILYGGIPADISILLIGGMTFALGIFKNFIAFIFLVLIYFLIYLAIKLSPKFDTKILKIAGRLKFKKYINP